MVSWAWYFGAIALGPFIAILACFWALAGFVVGFLGRRGRTHPLLIAGVWVLSEAFLARWPYGGFSWGEVGYAFHDIAIMRSLGALGGLPLISFVAVAINAGIADLISGGRRSPRVFAKRIGLIGALIGATLVWAILIPGPRISGSFRFALLQGNDINRDLTDAEYFAGTLPENHFALAEKLKGEFDLIVFPESTFTDAPNAPSAPFADFEWPQRLADLAVRHNSYVLANGTGDAPDGRALNLNVLWSPQGREVGEYAKRHRVPFGEWVPMRSFIAKFVKAVEQIPRDFAPGDVRGLFKVGDTKIATVICFESMFGAEVRPLVADGAELIVVSTNNRSYRRSANSRQHLAAAQIRAVETGRPVLQAAISGISAVIDSNGEVLAAQPLFENGSLEGTIKTRTGTTPYVRFGEWVLILLFFCFTWSLARALIVKRVQSRQVRSIN